VRLGRWAYLRWGQLLVFLMLVGCATHQEQSSFEPQLSRSGRFVLKVQSPGKEAESVQGSFYWRQNAGGWQLDLLSPLGATLARIEAVNDKGVVLIRPGEPVVKAGSASDLASRMFGAQVPMDALPDWLQGQVSPKFDIRMIERGEDDQIVKLNQQGWTASFSRYDQVGPQSIDVRGLDQSTEVQLRLVVQGALTA